MQGAQLGENMRQFDAGMGQRASEFGANLGLNYDQMGLQSQFQNASNALQAQGLGQADRQFGANLGQRESEFGRNFGFGQQRADMADLMALLGYGQQSVNSNNQTIGADMQRTLAMLGLIPGMGPTPIDVMGPANQYQQNQNAANQQTSANQNAMWQTYGTLAAALLSDRRAKTDIRKVGTLDNGLSVYVYRYKHGGPPQIGLMAQEVAEVNPSAVVDIDGLLHVNYAEAVR